MTRKILCAALAGLLLAACDDLAMDRCRDVVCPQGQACDSASGQCLPTESPCAAVLCPAGSLCDPADGLCKGGVLDRCRNVSCDADKSCDPDSGACRPNPPPPMLPMTVIDRVGRPGVGPLLINPFGLVPVGPPMMTMPERTDVSLDKYNAEGTPARWLAAFGPYLRFNLPIFDALDGICGNQLLAAAALNANRYANLANLLALDALHVNTATGSCGAFLAVELGAADCGGFRPSYDVIDTLYTLLITGTVITPVSDGIAASAPLSDTFPFLSPAQ